MEHAFRILALPAIARRFLQCRLVSGCHHRSRIRYWPGRQATDATADRANARLGAEGNGGRRARHRDVAYLSAGVLCEYGRVYRTLQSRREISWQIHFAYAERR